MADRLYLSYRIRGFHALDTLRTWEKMLRLFPYSRLGKTWATLWVYAVSYDEPPVLEQPFPPPLQLDDVLAAAGEFFHDDCACVLEAWWDIWQYDQDWTVRPARVSLCCFGPEFEDETEDHLRVDFGPDTQFVPAPGVDRAAFMAQSNLKSLLHMVHQIDDALEVDRRSLWTESGENFAERLQTVLESEGTGEA